MWAGTYGNDEVARALLESGADPRLKDEEGKTASFWADRNKHEELGKFLREQEGKSKK